MSAKVEQSKGGVVLVTSDGPEHRYVAHRIADAIDLRAILICDPAPRRKWHKVLRRDPVGFVNKALWKLYLKILGDASDRHRALRAIFGMQAEEFPDVPLLRVGRAKQGKLHSTVAEMSPNILAVYGTSLIPDDVLALPRQIALNMHTGISPYYRGTSCAFWPIHNGEPEFVGATVHECTAALDGGQIFATRKAILRKKDGLHHVFGRAVTAGAEAYAEVITAAQKQKLKGSAQDLSIGHEYRGSARGFISEVRARWQVARLQKQWTTPDT